MLHKQGNQPEEPTHELIWFFRLLMFTIIAYHVNNVNMNLMIILYYGHFWIQCVQHVDIMDKRNYLIAYYDYNMILFFHDRFD